MRPLDDVGLPQTSYVEQSFEPWKGRVRLATSQSLVGPEGSALRTTLCTTCAHSNFIHSDYDERACLVGACECPSYSTERGGGGPPSRSIAPAVIVASKRGNTITLALSAADSIERAATLARLGWTIRVVRGQ
jgi:hypothetical protein